MAPETDKMRFRTRLALSLISAAVIGVEISLMRVLAMHFWYHFAAMVIGVALLGFGAGGTFLTLFQNRVKPRRVFWLAATGLATAFSILLSVQAVQTIPLDVYFFAWDPFSESMRVLQIECLLMLPFLSAGLFIGLALMDRPESIHGHYAANLMGSGAGALLAVLLPNVLSTPDLLIFWSILCFVAGMCFLNRRSGAAVAALTGAAAGLWICIRLFPDAIAVSDYKKLTLERLKPGTRVLFTEEGPYGRIDIVAGPAVHDAPPGMSLNNPYPIPERRLVIIDGDQTHIVYNAQAATDLQFLNYTTTALPFYVRMRYDRSLIMGAGGGAPLWLAKQHDCRHITAIEPNRRMADVIQRYMGAAGVSAYKLPGGRHCFLEARSALGEQDTSFDLILIPMLDPASPAGNSPHAGRENFLFTLEAFRHCLRQLANGGFLCVTVLAKLPPRDGLRLFHLAARALEQEKRDPNQCLALVRSWETVTLLAAETPLTPDQCSAIRNFCETRGFDICFLPGLKPRDANRYHVLPAPDYYQGATALLKNSGRAFVSQYVFDLSAPTDDRPYFDHFLRWDRLAALRLKLKGSMPAFLEFGSLLLGAALLQTLLLAALLIVLPLFFNPAGLVRVRRKTAVLLYFFMLGIGFMFLEMCYLHKMMRYLGQPVYSAAAVIAAFLVFSGLGSLVSSRWPRQSTAATVAAFASAVVAIGYLCFLDTGLKWTEGSHTALRFITVFVAMGPLSFAMGHLFPIGLRRVGKSAPHMVPWAWAVNGFASVLATSGASLAALNLGFSTVILTAALCYVAAGFLVPILFRREPRS